MILLALLILGLPKQAKYLPFHVHIRAGIPTSLFCSWLQRLGMRWGLHFARWCGYADKMEPLLKAFSIEKHGIRERKWHYPALQMELDTIMWH